MPVCPVPPAQDPDAAGMITMGYLTLDDIARVKHVLAFTGWTEEDPIENDFGASAGFGFDVSFDKTALKSRADADQLGKIEETLVAFQDDVIFDKLSYAVEIEFQLVKR